MPRALALVLAVAQLACSDDLRDLNTVTLTIESPASEATAFSLTPLLFQVSAQSVAGVRTITLKAGDRELHRCTGGVGEAFEIVPCEKTFDLRDYAAQQKNARLVLTAIADDADGETTTMTVEILVKPLRITFAQPTGPEPVAVAGTSRLALTVEGELPIEQVKTTFDDAMPLQLFTSAPYETQLDWQAFVGSGTHTLTAEATDSLGRLDTATLTILVP